VKIISHLLEVMERIRGERIARRSFPKDLDKISEATGINNNSGCGEEKTKNIGEDIGSDIRNIDELLVELKNNEPTSDNQFFRLAIIAYEVGDINRSIVYAERFKEDKDARIAYLANGKLAMADALTQLYLLCQSLGWNFHELRKLGAEHLKERHYDFKEQGWSELK
jgi:hypothetical protein